MKTKKFLCLAFASCLMTGHALAQVPPVARKLPTAASVAKQGTVIKRIKYNGWEEAYTISNGIVEATIVPAIGRIMQFKYVDEVDGPFWSDITLEGTLPDPKSNDWANFGGDKTWPAPQADWPRVINRSWPPPAGFDSMPTQVQTNANSIVLTTPIDPDYGIRAERMITLAPRAAIMKVTTKYEKVRGNILNVSIWTITQLKHPEAVFMPASPSPTMKDGYVQQSQNLPENLKVEGGLISLTRGKTKTSKIGNAADAMVWAGKEWLVKISQPRVQNRTYPDGGSSAEVYTNGDPFSYVELETLGPLTPLDMGDNSSVTTTYELRKRNKLPLVKQARDFLGLK
ncbi:MAG: DUF4380 domain-containing protein [Verrucomicrobiales bacterium]